MTNIWFTADTHFGHANIIKYSNRPFDNVEEMNNALISNWNKVVGDKDIVYHLGDFCFGNPRNYITQLNGDIVHLIRGSHDKNSQQYIDCGNLIIIQPDGLHDEYGNPRFITLGHYAMRSWHLSHYASWHLFGHHHGNLEPYGLSFDVGVDCWGYFPVSLDEVAEKMKTLNPIVDFRKSNKK